MSDNKLDLSSHPRFDEIRDLEEQGFIIASAESHFEVYEVDEDGDPILQVGGPFADVDEALDAAFHL